MNINLKRILLFVSIAFSSILIFLFTAPEHLVVVNFLLILLFVLSLKENKNDLTKTSPKVQGKHTAVNFSVEESRQIADHTINSLLALLNEKSGSSQTIFFEYDKNDDALVMFNRDVFENSGTTIKYSSKDGILGALFRFKKDFHLFNENPSLKQVNYLSKGMVPLSFFGTPLLEKDAVVGLLCCHSLSKLKFSEEDLREILIFKNLIHNTINEWKKLEYANEVAESFKKFYKLSKLLNNKLLKNNMKRGPILEELVEFLKEIISFDFVAIGIKSGEKNYSIQFTNAKEAEHIKNREFEIKPTENRISKAFNVFDCWGDEKVENSLKPIPIFDEQVEFKNKLQSLYFFPIGNEEEIFGICVVGTNTPYTMAEDKKNLLKVFFNITYSYLLNTKLYDEVEERSFTDGLTKLYNHRHFQEKLVEKICEAERYPQNITILLLDLDHFKKINDTHGHPAGDLILQRVSQILKRNTRKVDIVARYGGEEFVIILTKTDFVHAKEIAERIRKQVEFEKILYNDVELKATLSIGGANYPEDGTDNINLIANADKALYYSKHNGRNQVTFFKALNIVYVPEISKKRNRF